VTIDKSQQWWRGTDAADLDELLREFAAASYPVDRVAHAKCSNCDATVFDVVLDDEEGCARRTCGTCGSSLLMLDSRDTVDSADLCQAACPCGGERFEMAVGFALRDDDEIHRASMYSRGDPRCLCRLEDRLFADRPTPRTSLNLRRGHLVITAR